MKKIFNIIIFTILTLSLMPLIGQAKEENVYANLNNEGSLTGLYVVNAFNLEKDTNFCDKGTYKKVTNLSTSEQLNNIDNKVCIDGKSGIFYYQGDLDNEKVALPWHFNIKYYLNGQEVNANALAGASGKLQITMNVTKNKDGNSFFFDNYLLQVTFVFNTRLTSNIKAPTATIANNAHNKEVKYTILSGNTKKITINADVKDFEMANISINGVPMQMDVNLEGVDKMIAEISQLQAAIKEINKGVNIVDQGVGIIKSGSTDLLMGAKQLKDALNVLNSKGTELMANAKYLKDALAGLDKNLKELYAANNQISYSMLSSLISSHQAMIGAYCSSEERAAECQLHTGTYQALMLLAGNKEFIDGLYAANLYSNYSMLYEGTGLFVGAASEIGYAYESLYGGLAILEGGLKDLKSGTTELAAGSNLLAKSTKNLTKMITDKVDQIEENFRNSKFKPLSFVDQSNKDITAVQFVIKTDSITKPKVNVTTTDEVEDSVWNRIKNIFN